MRCEPVKLKDGSLVLVNLPPGAVVTDEDRAVIEEFAEYLRIKKLCLAATVFWPDDEACDAECELPKGHDPANVHRDPILGEWDEDEMNTWTRE